MLALSSTNIFLLALVCIIGFFTLKLYEIKAGRRLVLAKRRRRVNESLKRLWGEVKRKTSESPETFQDKLRLVGSKALNRLAEWLKHLAHSIRD